MWHSKDESAVLLEENRRWSSPPLPTPGRSRGQALEYQGKKRKTRRELFLERMDGLIPWQLLEDRIRPFYPKAGRGRQPYPLSVMLRTHCVQLFLQPERPGHGGPALRVRPGAAVRGAETLRPPAR